MARTKAYAPTPDLVKKNVTLKIKPTTKNQLKAELSGVYSFASGSTIEHAKKHANGNDAAVVAGYFQWVNSEARRAAREELLEPGKKLNSIAQRMVDQGFAPSLEIARGILEAAKAGNLKVPASPAVANPAVSAPAPVSK